MDFLPPFDQFKAQFSSGAPALVWARWVADCETPVSAMLKVMEDGRPCFLLESVHGGETRGRYSIIGLDPDVIWRCRRDKAEMNATGSLLDADFKPCKEGALASLKKLVRESTLPIEGDLPPMAAGLIGYMGYDMVKLMEKLPDKNPDPIGLPDAMFMRPRVMVIFDAALGELFVVTPLWKDHGFTDAKKAYDAATARLTPVVEKLQKPLKGSPPLEGGQAEAENPPSLAGEGRGGVSMPLAHGVGHKDYSTRRPDSLQKASELRKTAPKAEQKLWQLLRGKQLEGHKFRRQETIGPYIVDFACQQQKLIIELDGDSHGETRQKYHDANRTRYLESAGYRVLRFWNIDLFENGESVLDVILQALRNTHTPTLPSPASGGGSLPPIPHSSPLTFTSNTTQAAYHAMVNKAKEYIKAGDIFQVVPSQRFCAPFSLPSFSLYRSLRHLNPSPFLFYLHFGDFSLVGSSPEILVRLRDGKVTIRPIAGTRKRGKNRAQDEALVKDLLADPKEIAEHLMLLDLGRNDVGRIAKIGSVKVTEHMTVEKYSHVMHIVSNVEGDIAPQYDAIDALIAGFPAGTVSGAPKIRAMEIIDEIESQRRSFYAGCVGYFAGDGAMDTCITLRTGLIKDGMLYVQAGGGVVADSDPEAEYQESCNKAAAIMRAAQDAEKFA